mmetsp:Transcript_10814/g.30671  ORF Transcript_10814/g.30671 Transcript_10814/m.30671 type:complete len:237 (-) Transcript_10814:1629-2339(-)
MLFGSISCSSPCFLSIQPLNLNTVTSPDLVSATSTLSKCHAAPRPLPSLITLIFWRTPMSAVETKKWSTIALSKLLAEVSSLSGSDCPASPISTMKTLLSVPAPRRSLVYTAILKCRLPSSPGRPAWSTRLQPSTPSSLVFFSQSLQGKKKVFRVKGCTTSTCSRCHDASGPLLSCRTTTWVISPMSIPATSNVSFLPLSKLLASLSSFVAPICPCSPWSSMNTLASVPAPLTSEV